MGRKEKGVITPYEFQELRRVYTIREIAKIKGYTENGLLRWCYRNNVNAEMLKRFNRLTELEKEIEKMKCCGNCRFSESDNLNGTFCHREGCFVVASAKCKLWEN